MIFVNLPGSLLVVTQSDHARLAADLLAMMQAPGLECHPRRDALLRAVAEHDNGWWEADAAPRLDPQSGAPVDFRSIDDETRREIWLRGVERHAQAEPYVAGMIVSHALRLLDSRFRPDRSWRPFLDLLTERRQELVEAAGLSLEELLADDSWLELADELALVGATGEAGFLDRRDLRAEARADELRTEVGLDPFPFVGSTTFELASRHLASRSRGSEVELARDLATARWGRRPVRFAPLARPG